MESCNPAKQYKAVAKLANGVADTNNSVISTSSESCRRTYDTRKQAVSEQSGNGWRLTEVAYKKQQTEIQKEQEQQAEAAAKLLSKGLSWMFGGSGSRSGSGSSGSKNTVYACYARCDAERDNTYAICSGMNTEGKGLFGTSSDRDECEYKARSAESSCKNACSY